MQKNTKTVLFAMAVLVLSLFLVQQHSSLSIITVSSGATFSSIQDAVNTANSEGGGTVILPPENINCNNELIQIPGGVNVYGQGIGSTVLTETVAAPFNAMFVVDGENGQPVRISGISFHGLVTSTDDNVLGSGIIMANANNFRVDHCEFVDFPNFAVDVSQTIPNCLTRGVIDHNLISDPYRRVFGPSTLWGYGVGVFSNDYSDWDSDITHFLGKYNTVPTFDPVAYIEDNTFNLTRHAVSSNQLGWYVFRDNTAFQDYNSVVDVHGSSSIAAGGRGGEVYNNVITGPIGIGFRGGSGVIYGNTIQAISSIEVLKDMDGVVLRPLNDLWIWNNNPDGASSDVNYIQNQDYFLRAPNQAQDGFTYTPLAYPFPFDTYGINDEQTPSSTPTPTHSGGGGGGGSSPTPTINPSISPSASNNPIKTFDWLSNAWIFLNNAWSNFWRWLIG